MSANESARYTISAGDTAGQIASLIGSGLQEWDKSRGDLNRAEMQARSIQASVHGARLALMGLLEHFKGLGTLLEQEVRDNFASASVHYDDAGNLILSALEGSNNDHATQATAGVQGTKSKAKSILETTDATLRDMNEVITALSSAAHTAQQVDAGITIVADASYAMQAQLHLPTAEAARSYVNGLTNGQGSQS